MKKATKVASGALAGVAVAIVAAGVKNMLSLEPARPNGAPIDAGDYHADDAAVERFREVLRIPTVSRDDVSQRDDAAFELMARTLRRLYPHTFEVFDEPIFFDTFGFLMRWEGADPSKASVLLMAHHDVVPANEEEWEYPPFAAEIHDGEIWARGTLDNKLCLCGCFEAFEYLAAQGWQPPRDVWFFSSCGEEVTGPAASEAASWLVEHGVNPAFVLDEGGAIATECPLGVDVPVAMVGVAEKGYVDLTVKAVSAGGHASSPSENDATRLLVRAVENICDNPGASRVMPAVERMLVELASHAAPAYRALFGNMGVFRPVVGLILSMGGETAAMVRTTYALTQLSGSPARNVLPTEATANINVRVAPFETIADAIARAQDLADEVATQAGMPGAITVSKAEEGDEPSPVAPFENDAAFDYLHRCVAGIYPEAGCAPYVQMGASDARHMHRHFDHVYRMAGYLYSKTARELVHAPNERIPVEDYKRGLGFYVALLRGLDQLEA